MTSRTRTLALRGALALVLVGALAGLALARPGGGESFSGGGGHSSGGSGGGGGGQLAFELVFWILRLVIYYPVIGLPLLGLVIAGVVISARRQHKNKDWDSGPPVQLKRAVRLDKLRARDPEFSQVLFEDFAFRLFAEAQRKRATPAELATVAPYVSEAARNHLLTRGPAQPVASVVVGALRITELALPSPAVLAAAEADPAAPRAVVRLQVEFEANVTTRQGTTYSVETWTFCRDAKVSSRPPGAAKGFPCPNCGAPWQASATGTQACASCGQVVDNGRFDWTVERIALASSEQRPPTLTTEVPERGTELQTYRAGNVDAEWASLEADDPAITEDSLVARLKLIYGDLNAAWANNEITPVRGLVSDGLFDYLQYWVDAYKQQKLRNQLTDMTITHTLVAKVVRDKHYDAITLRVWATGKDFVINTDTGRVVRGSKTKNRAYTEYWTLIRSRTRTGLPNPKRSCSNCGAELKITMAGACEFCNAHVTAGEFDWVLSKIEQDDTYRG